MTTTRQHIEDLDVQKWAALTRRAAAEAVAAAERLGIQPRAESLALAGMSERELVEHRERNGPPVPSRSLAMQLVEAEHLRRKAEDQTRNAHQGRLDAEAAASLARGEAVDSARAATAASDRVRAIETEVARKDAERAAERAADQQAVQQAQAQTDRVRAGAAAEVAAAEEKVRAAEARASERSVERAAERAAGEKTVQQLHAEIARVRAETAAEVAAAEERAKAAEARAEQRITERTAERATGEEAVQKVQLELEKVRSDAAAEVAAAQGKASGVVAAAREAADAEVAAAHQAAAAEIANWRAHAANMERWARGEVSKQLLTIPIPPWELRNRIGTVENTVDALYQIDYVLEVGLSEEAELQFVPDLEFTRSLAQKVQQQARDLTAELANLPGRYTEPPEVAVATGYAVAARDTYRALLQRIDAAIEGLGSRFHSPDAEIIAAVTAMLADLRTQGLY
jgi:colicin import membrane protein